MWRAILVSMRPKQMYKNLVLFIGIIFAAKLGDLSLWPTILLAFLIFCAISGAAYLINDVKDRDLDKVHPKKSKRPIASGELSVKSAIAVSIFLFIISLAASLLIDRSFFLISLLFLGLMLAYTFVLKNYPIVDIMTISSDFVLRAVAGCIAIAVVISPWLVICTFLLALFMALGKRRHEVQSLGEAAIEHRSSNAMYTTYMLDQMIMITAAALMMSYSLYTFQSANQYMMLTIPIALYGLFRYISIIQAKDGGGEPERLLADAGMRASLIIWVMASVVITSGLARMAAELVVK